MSQDCRTASVYVPVGYAHPYIGSIRDDGLRQDYGGHRRRPVHRERPQYLQLVPREYEGYAREGRLTHARAHRRVRIRHRARGRRRNRRGHPQRAGQERCIRSHHYTLYEPQAVCFSRYRSDERSDDVRREEHCAYVQARDGTSGQFVRLRARPQDGTSREYHQGCGDKSRRRVRGNRAQPAQDRKKPQGTRREA